MEVIHVHANTPTSPRNLERSDTPRAYIDLCSSMSSIAFNEWLGICQRRKGKKVQRDLLH